MVDCVDVIEVRLNLTLNAVERDRLSRAKCAVKLLVFPLRQWTEAVQVVSGRCHEVRRDAVALALA